MIGLRHLPTQETESEERRPFYKLKNRNFQMSQKKQWQGEGYEKLVRTFQNWQIEQFRFRVYGSPNIIKTIKNIKFPRLKKLIIEGNQLQSIQSLNTIKMPQLQVLSLNNNHVTKISPLTKCYCPKLQSIDCERNPITDFHRSSECKWFKVNKINIQNISCENFRWVLKLEAEKLDNLWWIKSDIMIQEKKHEDIFRAKYEQIEQATD